jgi:hypothetical protein
MNVIGSWTVLVVLFYSGRTIEIVRPGIKAWRVCPKPESLLIRVYGRPRVMSPKAAAVEASDYAKRKLICLCLCSLGLISVAREHHLVILEVIRKVHQH